MQKKIGLQVLFSYVGMKRVAAFRKIYIGKTACSIHKYLNLNETCKSCFIRLSHQIWCLDRIPPDLQINLVQRCKCFETLSGGDVRTMWFFQTKAGQMICCGDHPMWQRKLHTPMWNATIFCERGVGDSTQTWGLLGLHFETSDGVTLRNIATLG